MFSRFVIILTVSLTSLFGFAWTSSGRNSHSTSRNSNSSVQPQTRTSGAIASVTQPPCLMCDWKVPAEVAEASLGDPCEDLLPAACLNARGEYKIKPVADQAGKKLKELVKTAQAKGAQQMGYPSAEAAMMSVFRKEGYPLKKDLSEKAKKYILENDYASFVDKKEIYEVMDQCDQDRKKLDEINVSEIQDLQQLSVINKQLEAFKAKYRSVSTQLFLKDIPGFLNKINIQCNIFASLQEELKAKNLLQHPIAMKFQNTCSKRRELRAKALELYLKQDDPATKTELVNFVQENSELLYVSVSSIKDSAAASPVTTSSDAKQLVYDNLNSRYEVCNNLGERFDSAPREITNSTLLALNTAKATVEYLIEQIYTPERKVIVQKIHQAAKREALAVAQRLTRDPLKLARIKDHYERMVFTWFTKPADDRFKHDKKLGIDVLDINQMDRTDVWTQAFAGNIEFFSSLNAFYLPDTKFGANDKPLSVTMHPMLLEIMETYPHAFLSVMAHEIGHNIDPEVTKFNNYNLAQEYAPLLQCLSSPDSIRMQDSQAGEAVADVVAAEVLAKLVSELPPARRQAAIYASIQGFCEMLDMGDNDLSLTLMEAHPDGILRISGIFGANQSLRKVMSCNQEAKRFRTCSILGAP